MTVSLYGDPLELIKIPTSMVVATLFASVAACGVQVWYPYREFHSVLIHTAFVLVCFHSSHVQTLSKNPRSRSLLGLCSVPNGRSDSDQCVDADDGVYDRMGKKEPRPNHVTFLGQRYPRLDHSWLHVLLSSTRTAVYDQTVCSSICFQDTSVYHVFFLGRPRP